MIPKTQKISQGDALKLIRQKKQTVPFTVWTHFHSWASTTSPASPSKYPDGLKLTSIEDWRRSASGPIYDKHKSFKFGITAYVWHYTSHYKNNRQEHVAFKRVVPEFHHTHIQTTRSGI